MGHPLLYKWNVNGSASGHDKEETKKRRKQAAEVDNVKREAGKIIERQTSENEKYCTQ